MEKGKKKKKKVALPGFEPRILCMAGQNANYYTRTDYTNNNEILSITISKQISETFTFNEENLIQQKSSKCCKQFIQTPGKR